MHSEVDGHQSDDNKNALDSDNCSMDNHGPLEVAESEENEGEQETQSEPNDTPEQPNKNLKRRRDSSKDVKSKPKKPKKEEAAPKRPRGRPRNPEKDEKVGKKGEKEFSVVVYVEVAVAPKLHAGKTHKGDKMVPQAPQRCGPFSMFRKTKWSKFLENIAAVSGIDQENLLLPGMTWRMQGKKEQDGLPLQSRDAFKAMRDILKNKSRKEQPVLLVHHPIVTGRGRLTDIEDGEACDRSTAASAEITRWSEKVNICCCLRLTQCGLPGSPPVLAQSR